MERFVINCLPTRSLVFSKENQLLLSYTSDFRWSDRNIGIRWQNRCHIDRLWKGVW